MREIDGILLAAGESRRMGYPKPLLRIDNESFLAHAAAIMLDVVERLIIVLGAHSERIRPAVPRDSRIVVVENRFYERGQLSSLKAGLPRRPRLPHWCISQTIRWSSLLLS